MKVIVKWKRTNGIVLLRCRSRHGGDCGLCLLQKKIWWLVASGAAIGHAGAVRAVVSQSLTVTSGGEPKWTSRANRPATPENARAKNLVAQKTIRYFKTERF